MLNNKTILITGGTGSFGKKICIEVLNKYKPKRLIVFSRDELKQYEMRQMFPEDKYPSLRFFIGNIRDRERLYRAFDGVDIVIHAAALKQVPSCEYNPIEAIKTNILGAANIIDAAIDKDVKKVVALSTDKASNPINLYGATKLCSDKLFVAANNYVGRHETKFSVVRYGNVVGSRGSVIPHFIKMRQVGVLPVTDPRMTRFWITLQEGVKFVLDSLERMNGGEIFVPKIPSMNIVDLAKAIAPKCDINVIGIRPGEKMHEMMISEDEAWHTVEYDAYYSILSVHDNAGITDYISNNGGIKCGDNFSYCSHTNDRWLTVENIETMIEMADVDGESTIKKKVSPGEEFVKNVSDSDVSVNP